MRRLVVLLCVLVCSASLMYGQKRRLGQAAPNPADYSIKIHISASHLREECTSNGCFNRLHVDAVLQGKKIELSGNEIDIKKKLVLVAPGDYYVRLIGSDNSSSRTFFSQTYDLLLPDGIVWRCATIGIAE